MTQNAVDILHDHYKDTYGLIRDREKQRDRSFLLLIGLYVLLFLEVQYPANFRGSVGTIDIAGTKIAISALPLGALLDASWALTLATVLTYCRVSISIERQYSYLHRLEEWISDRIGATGLYRREGQAYLEGYPVLLNWVWFCYVVVFPAVALTATGALLVIELHLLPYSFAHKGVDVAIGLSMMISFMLYRVLPQMVQAARRHRILERWTRWWVRLRTWRPGISN